MIVKEAHNSSSDSNIPYSKHHRFKKSDQQFFQLLGGILFEFLTFEDKEWD